jgi:hypothetical protein
LLEPVLLVDNSGFFEGEDEIIIDDIPDELSFEYKDPAHDFKTGGTNVSRLFRQYQNQSLDLAKTKGLFVESNVHEILALSSILMLVPDSYSNTMIGLFGLPLLEEIYQQLKPARQQTTLDSKCEMTFKKAIKTAINDSRDNATNWLCAQITNEQSLRENLGFVVLDCLRTLPISKIRSEHSEITHITNYLDRIMRGL